MTEKKKIRCKYDAKGCYRRSSEHWEEYDHVVSKMPTDMHSSSSDFISRPTTASSGGSFGGGGGGGDAEGDADSSNDEDSDDPEQRGPCGYGSECTKVKAAHFRIYSHPPGVTAEENMRKRQPCKFEPNCLSINPAHFLRHAHKPGKTAETNYKNRPTCKYDPACRRTKDLFHMQTNLHPSLENPVAVNITSASAVNDEGMVTLTVGDTTVCITPEQAKNVPACLKDPNVVGLRGSEGDTLTLFHVTSEECAKSIQMGGFRSSTTGWLLLGPGIYFGKNIKECCYKSRAVPLDTYLQCTVAVGRMLQVKGPVPTLNEEAARFAGFTGVYRNEIGKNDEWIVYDKGRVRIDEVAKFDSSQHQLGKKK